MIRSISPSSGRSRHSRPSRTYRFPISLVQEILLQGLRCLASVGIYACDGRVWLQASASVGCCQKFFLAHSAIGAALFPIFFETLLARHGRGRCKCSSDSSWSEGQCRHGSCFQETYRKWRSFDGSLHHGGFKIVG